LVSVDVNGRAFCTAVVWITVSRQPRLLQRFDTDHLPDLSNVVRDLNGDGVPDIVFPVAWSVGGGAGFCPAIRYQVFHCQGESCTDVSGAHPELFRERLRSLLDRLDQTANSSASEDKRIRPCIEMERDWIIRHVNGDPNAGLALARSWLTTAGPENLELRLKAIAVLRDIANDNAIRTLQQTAAGKDQALAGAARGALSAIAAAKKGGLRGGASETTFR
jgi:hypothetical protein